MKCEREKKWSNKNDGKLLIKISVYRRLPDQCLIVCNERNEYIFGIHKKKLHKFAKQMAACGVQYFEIEFIHYKNPMGYFLFN